MGGRNPQTTRLRNKVVRLFNAGHTQAQIGDQLGITRGAAGRLIMEARAQDVLTVDYTPSEVSERAQASYRARLGEVAYRAEMDRRMSALRQATREKNQAAGPPPE